jgi:hypothetical protein
VRHVILAVFMGISALAVVSAAAAQADPTGTLVGRVVVCKSLPRPVAPLAQLADLTPGGDRRLPPPLQVPAGSLPVNVEGTSVSVLTDAAGRFTLAGVPAAQQLTLLAQQQDGPLLVLNAPNLTVTAGQTLDLGTVALGACGDGGMVFVPRPMPEDDAASE